MRSLLIRILILHRMGQLICFRDNKKGFPPSSIRLPGQQKSLYFYVFSVFIYLFRDRRHTVSACTYCRHQSAYYRRNRAYFLSVVVSRQNPINDYYTGGALPYIPFNDYYYIFHFNSAEKQSPGSLMAQQMPQIAPFCPIILRIAGSPEVLPWQMNSILITIIFLLRRCDLPWVADFSIISFCAHIMPTFAEQAKRGKMHPCELLG